MGASPAYRNAHAVTTQEFLASRPHYAGGVKHRTLAGEMAIARAKSMGED
jgi:hypothetical protein